MSKWLSGQPLPLIKAEVYVEQTNALGHLKAVEYVAIFDDATVDFFTKTALTDGHLRHGETSPFLVELHTCYLKELGPGERVATTAQVLDHDVKRARVILSMTALGDHTLVATCELAVINMGLTDRKPVPWSSAQGEIWSTLRAAHASLPDLPQAGRSIQPLTKR